MERHCETGIPRRGFLALAAATTTQAASANRVVAEALREKPPVTGEADPRLEPFDELMSSFIQEHKIPGASLAVTRSGKLVYARGFGFADVELRVPVQPTALLRIASVSKPLTSVAMLQLVDRRKLRLDDPVTDHLKVQPFLPQDARLDRRWNQVTIRHCLQHTGGWDRGKSFDPIARPRRIAEALGIRPPVTPDQVVSYMMGQPLDFNPGERFAYSNLGYLVLARVLEAVTGRSYESYVQQEVCAPLGIKTMRLGHALLERRAAGEVKYYDSQSRQGLCLYPPKVGQQVPMQYGAENFEAFEAHGGWIASATDLVRFASAFDDVNSCPILSAQAIQEMWARPVGTAGEDADGKPKPAYYGCGWMVRPRGNTGLCNAWHAGFIAGSEALLVRRWDHLSWAVLFNTSMRRAGKSLAQLIDSRLHRAANAVKSWPDVNLFESQ